jgi:hypothetical protein
MKKKLAAVITTVGYFAFSTAAYAQQNIRVSQPTTNSGGPVGYGTINAFINAALRLAFIAALIIALVMLVWGAVEWVLSGGSKDAVASARGRIVHALIGLAILAVAFAVVNLAGSFLGFNLLGNFIIPSPASPTPGLPDPTI